MIFFSVSCALLVCVVLLPPEIGGFGGTGSPVTTNQPNVAKVSVFFTELLILPLVAMAKGLIKTLLV